MSDWQPDLYNRFRRYRAEPFGHILERLPITEGDTIADLGCGPGDNTVELARRLTTGNARGIDLSPAMIEAAEKLRAGLPAQLREQVSFAVGDIAQLNGLGIYSIVFSNAALQWLGDHRTVLARWFSALAPGGAMVVQMPANESETAKLDLSRMVLEPRWSSLLGPVDRPFGEVPPPEHYERIMREIGFAEVDCYYRTFHHPMNSPAEVVQWYRSTGLRPFLDALPKDRHDQFLSAYGERLERAYGTSGPMTFDFKRLFLWGRRPAV
ncbi:MAG: methyltransferase domain-containing protein [Candidatus Binataceae bacterium]